MEIDNRYWAGLFDGEGCVYIAPEGRHIQVNVVQKEKPVLYLLKNRFGGAIDLHNKGKTFCWQWRICSAKDITVFLNAIAPYCIVKAVEIQIALELVGGFCKGEYNNGYNGGKKLPQEELDRRAKLVARFKTDRADLKQYPLEN